jgi:hypothetical protein
MECLVNRINTPGGLIPPNTTAHHCPKCNNFLCGMPCSALAKQEELCCYPCHEGKTSEEIVASRTTVDAPTETKEAVNDAAGSAIVPNEAPVVNTETAIDKDNKPERERKSIVRFSDESNLFISKRKLPTRAAKSPTANASRPTTTTATTPEDLSVVPRNVLKRLFKPTQMKQKHYWEVMSLVAPVARFPKGVTEWTTKDAVAAYCHDCNVMVKYAYRKTAKMTEHYNNFHLQDKKDEIEKDVQLKELKF